MKINHLLLIVTLLMLLMPVAAQEDTTTVSDDDVNRVAKKLYCPVCENITLDTCGTAACEDWRYEIELQLEQGKTDTEIIDDFVMRFGDRVVGTPQDPTLRALTLVTPWLIIIAGFCALLYGSFRWWSSRGMTPQPAEAAPTPKAPLSDYQAQLERDLEG